MYDFSIFWAAARAVLAGISPYTVHNYISPPIVAWCFIPLGLIENVVTAARLFALVNLVALGYWASRDHRLLSLKAALFYPTVFLGTAGNIDLIVLVVGLWGWAPLLGLLVLIKPQLALVVLAWRWLQWDRDERWMKLATVAGMASAGWLAMGILSPGWVSEWMRAAPSLGAYTLSWGVSGWASSWSTLVMGLTGAALLLSPGWKHPPTWWATVAIINPMTRVYTLVMLLPYLDWWMVGLSWAAFGLRMATDSAYPFVIVPLYLLWREAVKAMRVPETIIPNKNGRIWGGGYGDDKWAEGEVR